MESDQGPRPASLALLICARHWCLATSSASQVLRSGRPLAGTPGTLHRPSPGQAWQGGQVFMRMSMTRAALRPQAQSWQRSAGRFDFSSVHRDWYYLLESQQDPLKQDKTLSLEESPDVALDALSSKT